MRHETSTALELRRPEEVPSRVTRLPEQMPPAPEVTPEEAEPRPTVEQMSANELRLMDEAKSAPVPNQVLQAAPMIKPSLVAPVQINGETCRDFLDALAFIAQEDSAIPIQRQVRVIYSDGEIQLEASDGRLWAIARIRATGGRDGFECVLPLKRARSVVKRILANYSTVSMGVDLESIHLGDYSLPHGGSTRDFPQRTMLLPEELKAVMPAHDIDAIVKRVAPIVRHDPCRAHLDGVHLDFNDGVAVSTDGHRLHMLRLAELRIDARDSYRARPTVTLPTHFFKFLQAVIEREWVGFNVSDRLVVVGGRDFGLMAQPLEGVFPDWRNTVPKPRRRMDRRPGGAARALAGRTCAEKRAGSAQRRRSDEPAHRGGARPRRATLPPLHHRASQGRPGRRPHRCQPGLSFATLPKPPTAAWFASA